MRWIILISVLAFGVGCARPIYLENSNSAVVEKASTGCSSTVDTVDRRCVSITWETRPTETTFGSFVFLFTKAKSPGPLAGNNDLFIPRGDSVRLKLWMPSMGHGSSPVAVERISPGVYRASHVFFTMAGDWDLHFQFFDGPTQIDEITLHVSW